MNANQTHVFDAVPAANEPLIINSEHLKIIDQFIAIIVAQTGATIIYISQRTKRMVIRSMVFGIVVSGITLFLMSSSAGPSLERFIISLSLGFIIFLMGVMVAFMHEADHYRNLISDLMGRTQLFRLSNTEDCPAIVLGTMKQINEHSCCSPIIGVPESDKSEMIGHG